MYSQANRAPCKTHRETHIVRHAGRAARRGAARVPQDETIRDRLLALELHTKPVETLVKAVSRGGAGRLYKPDPVAERVETQLVCYLREHSN